MKKISFYHKIAIGLMTASLALGFTSCKKHTNETTAAPAAGTTAVKGVLHGNIHWTADQHILLKGYVYIDSGSVLTIDAGTVIKGDKETKGALIIEKGAQIKAVGTPTSPIVFTSNQTPGNRNYGDWGGVILCGRAKNNWVAAKHNDGTTGFYTPGIGQVEGGPRSLYGGSDDRDNSGVLQYVRIEFGGVAFTPNNEVNGLTLCSVGDGTTIDHIQVSYSGDDSYEWFGGTVNAKYLICHRGWDDDFDTDNGFSGNVQYGMILRDPMAADYSGSHSFESDSRNENSTALPLTQAVFSNVTAVGPLTSPLYNGYNPNFVCGAVLRRSSSLSIMNSVIVGYPSGVIIDEDAAGNFGSTIANIQNNSLQIANTAFVGMPADSMVALYRISEPHSSPNNVSKAMDADTTTGEFGSYSGPVSWLKSNGCRIYKNEGTTSKLYNAFSLTAPNFVPTTSSVLSVIPPATAPAMKASFTSSKFTSNSYFDQGINYAGSCSGDAVSNWAQGWTNFDPQNANYGSGY